MLLDLSTPAVMGILNLTPDSFFDGGKYSSEVDYMQHTHLMLENGAKIIDIGGQSSRPGAVTLDEEEEWRRIKNPLSKLIKEFPSAIFSIDTFYASVAKRAVDSGASIVNDISGGTMDKNMFQTIAGLKVPYILTHIKGTPESMQNDPQYDNLLPEILDFFVEQTEQLMMLGITDIIIDPGFGFGKTNEHNYQILKNLHLFKMLGYPVMAGLSRKSMITKVLKTKTIDSLNGTTVLNTIALMNGATILRVHDVKEAYEAIQLVRLMKSV